MPERKQSLAYINVRKYSGKDNTYIQILCKNILKVQNSAFFSYIYVLPNIIGADFLGLQQEPHFALFRQDSYLEMLVLHLVTRRPYLIAIPIAITSITFGADGPRPVFMDTDSRRTLFVNKLFVLHTSAMVCIPHL